MERERLIDSIIREVKGEFAAEGETAELANFAYDRGQEYARTRRFDNSRYYHNYTFRLDDGTPVMSSSFFSIFMTRNQTGAYLDAEKVVKGLLGDEDEKLFHMVRDQRFGINGVFKAALSPREPEQISYTDYVLIIACFCAGVFNKEN